MEQGGRELAGMFHDYMYRNHLVVVGLSARASSTGKIYQSFSTDYWASIMKLTFQFRKANMMAPE